MNGGGLGVGGLSRFCTIFVFLVVGVVVLGACSLDDPLAQTDPGGNQPIGESGWDIAVIVEPGDGVAGQGLVASFQIVDEGGEPLGEGGLEVELTLNQGAFAGAVERMEGLTNRQGAVEFEFIIEEAGVDYQLLALASDDSGEVREVVTSLFEIVAAAPSPEMSSITGGEGYVDDEEGAPVRIELFDEFGNPVVGVVPEFQASGEGNEYGECTETDESGVSLCVMTSSAVGEQRLEVVEPVEFEGGTVRFINDLGFRLASNMPQEQVAGRSFTVAVQLLGSRGIALEEGGVEVEVELNRGGFSTGESVESAVTTEAGIAFFELAVEQAGEGYALIVRSLDERFEGITFISPDFRVVAAEASAEESAIRGEDGDIVNGAAVEIELFDEFGNPLVGVVPVFEASGEGNSYGPCTEVDEDGVSTCRLESTAGGAKKLKLMEPVEVEGETIHISAPADIDVVLGPGASVVAGAEIDVALQVVDHRGDPYEFSGVELELTLNKGKFSDGKTALKAQTNGEGVAKFSAAIEAAGRGYVLTGSSEEENLAGVSKQVASFDVTSGDASPEHSVIRGEDGQVGSPAGAAVEIELFDKFGNPVIGVVPRFSATGSGNSYGVCSATDEAGRSNCVLTSTGVGEKTLKITSPVEREGGKVEFFGPDKLEIITAPPASGVAGENFTLVVEVRDRRGQAFEVAGVELLATLNRSEFAGYGSGGVIKSTNAAGRAEFSLAINKADTGYVITTELKMSPYPHLSVATSPFAVGAGEASAGKSWIEGSDGYVNDSAGAAIEIGLFDVYENPIVGVTPTFSATGSGNSYGACSATNVQGISTCVMTSTQAEKKTLRITSPVQVTGGMVEFSWSCDPGRASWGGGSGSESDPYLICAPKHFQNIGNVDTAGKYFVITRDLDMSGVNDFVPIEEFSGVLDGGGKRLSGLKIDMESHQHRQRTGIFRRIGESGKIQHLRVEGVAISGGELSGGLVAHNEGYIGRVSLEGYVYLNDCEVGGVVYVNDGVIEQSYSDISLWADCASGGFVGENNGHIRDSYSVARVLDNNYYYTAGFVVSNRGEGAIVNSYSAAVPYFGVNSGCCHNIDIEAIWAAAYPDLWIGSPNSMGGAGIFMTDDGANSLDYRSYYDVDLIAPGASVGFGASPLTREEFRESSNFVGWDFDNVWIIGTAPDGEKRPILRWQVGL